MTQKTKTFGFLGSVALIFISLVLRPPVASVGPLLHEIITDFGLSAAETSLITSAPVFCFGLGAFASPALVRKFGVNRSMLLVLIALLLAVSLRLFFGYPGLLVGTLAAGLSIAVANVLLPTIVRVEFPSRVTLVTGIYTTILVSSASYAAWVAVPSSASVGGWRPALALWVLPTLLAVLFWLPKSFGSQAVVAPLASAPIEQRSAVAHSPISWAIVGLFGLQSLGFYSLLGWLPSLLIARGETPESAGSYLGLVTAIGIPAGLFLSIAISKFNSLAWWVAGASALTLTGFMLLLAAFETPSLTAVSCVFLGVGQASAFPLSLSLISTRASTKAQTTQLSSMAQGWGYLLAATGTFVVGLLAETSGSWALSVGLLAALTLVQVGVGFYSGRPGVIPAK